MSKSHPPDETSELSELFVTITGDETVTERQREGTSKQPIEPAEAFEGLDDGLRDAVGSDLDPE